MILVFGKTGQVARELARLAPESLTLLDREAADLSDPAACAMAIKRLAPRAVINAAAYTAVDRAEEEEETATRINGAAPGAMARACADRGIPMVHISTDYVFDGSGAAPRAPGAATAPLNAYGRSKLAGEEAVRGALEAHAILRTSWVFSAHGANFVKTMLRLGASRESLTVVADQIGGPTPAAAIARACLTMAEALAEGRGTPGTYHFAGTPETSWAGFAREIMAQAGLSCEIHDIPTRDFPTPAERPFNSRLDCSALQEAFGIAGPDWRAELAEVLAELRQG